MRLTNVTHLRLPFGRLWGYDVAVGERYAPLPVSFDQRRHVEVGDRPGSWMALSFQLSEQIDLDRLGAAWLEVIQRHGTLRSVFTPSAAGPELWQVEVSAGAWVEHTIEPGQAVNDALRRVLDEKCSPYQQPSHRLCVLDTTVGPTVVIGADHSHVDMWSLLVIARDLLAFLGMNDADAHFIAASTPPPAFAEHTHALRERPVAPDDARARWAEIIAASGDVMPCFPLSLGDVETLQPERVEVRDVLDVDESAAFAMQARDEGVSTLTLVISAMTAVTRDVANAPLRAVFPVHSRYDPVWHDSVGWFITNSVLESDDSAPRACAAAVKEAIGLGSWSLEDVLEPWGGMPAAPGMFAISWLDLRRLPVRIDADGLQAQYVGSAIETDGVMLWFILNDSGLHLRCRYPDTPEARSHVGLWLDSLITRLRAQAHASISSRLRVGDEIYRVERANRADVPALVALLSDDDVAPERESAQLSRYEIAFDAVTRDRSHFLAAVRDADDNVVGTMQLTIVPGLSRGGTTRLQVEGVRVASPLRGRGIGTAMMTWAHAHGRAHQATLSQLATDVQRHRARAFYARLGYIDSHLGLKREL